MPNETTSADVRVVFSVIDKATPAIQEISKSLEGVAQANADVQASVPRSMAEQAKMFGYAWDPEKVVPNVAPEVEKQVAEIGKAIAPMKEHIAGVGESVRTLFTELGTGLREKLGGAITSVRGWASELGGTLKAAFTPILEIGAGVAGGAFLAFWKAAAEGMDETVRAAKELGTRAASLNVTVEQLQELQHWMVESGGTAKELDTSLLRLTRGIGAVKEGGKGAKSIAGVLESFGITDLENVKTGADLLPKLAEGFRGLDDATERARRGFILFGGTWEQTVDALRKGPQAIDDAAAAQKRLGELTTQQVADGVAFAKSQEHLAEAMKQTRMAVGAQLLPEMTKLNEQMATYTEQNREAIATDFAGGLEQIAGFVKSTKADIEGIAHAWTAVKTSFVDMWTTIKSYTDIPLFDTWTRAADAMKSEWEKFKAVPPETYVAGSVPGVPPPPLTGPPASGTVNVTIENKNAPPGQTTAATATGAAKIKSVDVGRSMPWSVPDYSGPYAPGGAP